MILAATLALAQDYRTFTLTDGRTFVGEVGATTASGIEVRVPHGVLDVAFTELVDMVDADADRYAAQDRWAVLAVGPGRDAALAALATIPELVVVGPGSDLAPAPDVTRALACADVACARDALASAARWLWIVEAPGGDPLVLRGHVSTGDGVREGSGTSDPTAAGNAARQALGLRPDYVASPSAKAPKQPKPTKEPKQREPQTADASRAMRLAWAPVPGLPSLAAGDGAGFGTALAVVIPATALWVGASGKQSQSVGQHVALSLGGFYAITLATNQILGRRSVDRAVTVSVAPNPDGGAGIAIRARLRGRPTVKHR